MQTNLNMNESVERRKKGFITSPQVTKAGGLRYNL
jgi:hypothetical protein